MMGLLASTPAIDLTGIDFGIMLSTIADIVPQILTAIIPLIALRKGIGFLYGALRGA